MKTEAESEQKERQKPVKKSKKVGNLLRVTLLTLSSEISPPLLL